MNAVEMQSFRRIDLAFSLADRICNEETHNGTNGRHIIAGTSENVTVRMKKSVLSWFGHVERMSDERMARFMIEK